MYLENVVSDAVDPARLGRFWGAALGGATLTDVPDVFETRVVVDGGPVLDYCFPRVPEAPDEPVRLHLDLRGGEQQHQVVDRVRGLGARPVDIGQGDVPWVVLADLEGNAFCVMETRREYEDTGPVAALPLDSGDPDRDAGFWAWLTGWTPVEGAGLMSLRHPSRRGPLLELCPEPRPKGPGKIRMHLDVRLEAENDADAVAREIVDRGGTELRPDWGDLPWRTFADPSGNDFCVLPHRG